MVSRSALPGYQYVEGEYMKVDEYEDLIRDPSELPAQDLFAADFRLI